MRTVFQSSSSPIDLQRAPKGDARDLAQLKSAGRRIIAKLGSLAVGEGYPVRIMAAVNVSPESFYKGSVVTTPKEIEARVREAVDEGAEMVDIGGMSTAPYLVNEVSAEVEAERVRSALAAVSGIDAVISVDTVRSSVAVEALKHGARVVNDVSGLKNDDRMATVVRDYGASLIAMAHSSSPGRGRPIAQVKRALSATLAIARKAGLEEDQIALDPGIGFFREEGAGRAYSPQSSMAWHEWDAEVIADLAVLHGLGRPICVGLSRKSFLGRILGLTDAGERLTASIAATAIAVANGADIIRTHDVRETLEATRLVEKLTAGRRRRLADRTS